MDRSGEGWEQCFKISTNGGEPVVLNARQNALQHLDMSQVQILLGSILPSIPPGIQHHVSKTGEFIFSTLLALVREVSPTLIATNVNSLKENKTKIVEPIINLILYMWMGKITRGLVKMPCGIYSDSSSLELKSHKVHTPRLIIKNVSDQVVQLI